MNLFDPETIGDDVMRTSFRAVLPSFMLFAVPYALPDFTGTWSFDPAKSGIEEYGNQPAITLDIQHTGNNLHIMRSMLFQGKPVTWEFSYILDGREHTLVSSGGNLKYKAVWNGNTLVISGTLATSKRQIPQTLSYSLSADGKVLTVTESIGSQGEAASKQIFIRK